MNPFKVLAVSILAATPIREDIGFHQSHCIADEEVDMGQD